MGCGGGVGGLPTNREPKEILKVMNSFISCLWWGTHDSMCLSKLIEQYTNKITVNSEK